MKKLATLALLLSLPLFSLGCDNAGEVDDDAAPVTADTDVGDGDLGDADTDIGE